MHGKASRMALGGMMTAVAVVIMCMGSLIPVNTYICPVLCIMITMPVRDRCGLRLAWCYYLAVAVLSLLMAPDREAALVYAFLGNYPLLRHWFQNIRISWLRTAAKLGYFSLAGAASMVLSMFVMGLDTGAEESMWMIPVAVVLWDVLFLLVDRLLGINWMRIRKTRS